MTEDVPQRAIPKQAVVSADVTVEDRDYFATARSSAFMSLILMLIVLGFLLGWHAVNPKALGPVPEVLAIVLTLFATTQADRIERPDRSTLRGQLFAMGNWLIGASVLPAITFAVALGFERAKRGRLRWAGRLHGAPVFLLGLMRRWPLMPTAGRIRQNAASCRPRRQITVISRHCGAILAGHDSRGPDDRPEGVRIRHLEESRPE